MNILISAGLLGVHCRYDGQASVCPHLAQLQQHYQLIPVCPEIMGGLPTPRQPAELCQGRVYDRSGRDITAAFARGAAEVLHLAELYQCRYAILKERSPSCGSGQVYDGNFSATLVAGDGVLAAALKEKGITVIGESQIEKFFL